MQKLGTRCCQSRVSESKQVQPTPMDVSAVAVTKAEQGDTWGDGPAEADKVSMEINQIKGNGNGSQCYRCGGYGHMAKNSPTPPVKGKDKGQGNDGKGGKGYGEEDRVCYNCGKKGHLSRDCWSVKVKGKGKENKLAKWPTHPWSSEEFG